MARRTRKEARRLQRQVWRLRLRGLTTALIAETLDITPALARHHLNRARRDFAHELAEVGPVDLLRETAARLLADRLLALERLDACSSERESVAWLRLASQANSDFTRLLQDSGAILAEPKGSADQ